MAAILVAMVAAHPAHANTSGGFDTVGPQMDFSVQGNTVGSWTSSNLTVQGNVGAAGTVKVGQTAAACTGAIEGSLRYDSAQHQMQFCDGTSWNAIQPVLQTCDFAGSGLCTAGGGCVVSFATTNGWTSQPAPPATWQDGDVYIWKEAYSTNNYAGAECRNGSLHVFETGN